MDQSHPFWQTASLTVAPTGSRRGYSADIKDRAGGALATCDAEGTVRDGAGDVLLLAPVRWEGRKDRPTDASVEVADPEGGALGAGRVAKYGVGPRSKRVTIAIVAPEGGEAARLEPRDRKGEQLAVVSDGREFATIAVAQVKTGFLGKARVYTVELADEIPETLRPLVLAIAIRYDALLNAVVAASARD